MVVTSAAIGKVDFILAFQVRILMKPLPWLQDSRQTSLKAARTLLQATSSNRDGTRVG